MSIAAVLASNHIINKIEDEIADLGKVEKASLLMERNIEWSKAAHEKAAMNGAMSDVALIAQYVKEWIEVQIKVAVECLSFDEEMKVFFGDCK